MKLYRFIFTIRHDDGVIRIENVAPNYDSARRAILAAERCPESAIRDVSCVDGRWFQLSAQNPDIYVVFPVPAPSVKTSLHKPFAKDATHYMARLGDQRWRRVFRGVVNNTDVLYVKYGKVKTIVTLPGVTA